MKGVYFCIDCGGGHGFDECPLAGLCKFCKTRPVTLHFGDMLSFTHGGGLNCCDLCAAEKQLAHAREQAALVPEREREVERLRALDTDDPWGSSPDSAPDSASDVSLGVRVAE